MFGWKSNIYQHCTDVGLHHVSEPCIKLSQDDLAMVAPAIRILFCVLHCSIRNEYLRTGSLIIIMSWLTLTWVCGCEKRLYKLLTSIQIYLSRCGSAHELISGFHVYIQPVPFNPHNDFIACQTNRDVAVNLQPTNLDPLSFMPQKAPLHLPILANTCTSLSYVQYNKSATKQRMPCQYYC